jgi:hypothetical protein
MFTLQEINQMVSLVNSHAAEFERKPHSLLWSEIPHLAKADDDATHVKCILYDIAVWDATGYARDAYIVCVEYDVPGVVRVPSNSHWYC